MTALSLSYELTLPTTGLASTPSAPSKSSFTCDLNTSTPRAHLKSLESALGEARDWLNNNLTEWKVALKDHEKERKPAKGEDDEDDE